MSSLYASPDSEFTLLNARESIAPPLNEEEIHAQLKILQDLRRDIKPVEELQFAVPSEMKDDDLLKLPTLEFCEHFIHAKLQYKEKQALLNGLLGIKEEISKHNNIISTLVATLNLPPEEKKKILETIGKYASDCIAQLELTKHDEELKKFVKYFEVMNPLLTKIREHFKETNLGSEVPVCGICFENKISYAVVPCGHTICADCKMKLSRSCFTCRGRFQQVIKIYMH